MRQVIHLAFRIHYSLLIRRLLTLLLLSAAVNVSAASPWQSWPTVGDARLTWGPWVIYDSQLRTPTGVYRNDTEDMALVIKYQRDIDKEDLLEATDEQWKHLGIPLSKRQKWLKRLAEIWPDVQKGDRLIFVVKKGSGVFFRDNRQIGVLTDKEMSMSFLHIWLSPKTSYPNIRRQLIGKA